MDYNQQCGGTSTKPRPFERASGRRVTPLPRRAGSLGLGGLPSGGARVAPSRDVLVRALSVRHLSERAERAKESAHRSKTKEEQGGGGKEAYLDGSSADFGAVESGHGVLRGVLVLELNEAELLPLWGEDALDGPEGRESRFEGLLVRAPENQARVPVHRPVLRGGRGRERTGRGRIGQEQERLARARKEARAEAAPVAAVRVAPFGRRRRPNSPWRLPLRLPGVHDEPK